MISLTFLLAHFSPFHIRDVLLICRSSQYDALLAAEAKAEKTKKGLFAEKEAGDKGSVLRIQELQGVRRFTWLFCEEVGLQFCHRSRANILH